ncbi:MAG: GNAT family N-acetyltransferase [Xanthobacteraceae bacterium]|nr:GNAT family N-acetyltransferase [Xanthobacteraceae bacterium]
MIGKLAALFRRAEPAILDARPGDASALAALHRVSFRHGWSENEFERLLSDRAAVAHVARTSGGRGAVVGFVLSHRVEYEAEILLVALAPGERGHGTATKLLSKHLGRLAAAGVSRVFLEVDEGNASARKLYARAGFKEVGRRAGYYRKPEGNAAALVLGRDLNA